MSRLTQIGGTSTLSFHLVEQSGGGEAPGHEQGPARRRPGHGAVGVFQSAAARAEAASGQPNGPLVARKGAPRAALPSRNLKKRRVTTGNTMRGSNKSKYKN